MSGVLNKIGTRSGRIWAGQSREAAVAGGAAPTFSALASGSIADGDKCIIRSDGKVASVAVVAGAPLDSATSDSQHQTLGLRAGWEAEAQGTATGDNKPDYPSHKPWISYDPDNENKFIVGYGNYNGTLQLKIGSISGTTISFGSAVEVDSNSNHSPCCVHFHPSTSNLFAVAYGTNNKVYIKFGTVSGTTISIVSSLLLSEWQDFGKNSGTFAFSWDFFSTTNHWALMYDWWSVSYGGQNTGKTARKMPAIICGVVSDTAGSPSKGSVHWLHGGYALDMNDDYWWYGGGQVRSLRFDPNNANKFLVTNFLNTNSTATNPAIWIATTNGSTTVTGSTQNAMAATIGITGRGEHHCEWNPAIANQFVFSGQQAWGTYDIDPVAVVGTVSGTSISWGTKFELMSGGPPVTSQPWEIFFGAGAADGRFYGASSRMPSGGLVGYIYVQAFDITGTTITSPAGWVSVANHQWFDLFYNTDHIGVVFPWHIAVSPDGSKAMISCLRATGSGNHTKFTSISIGGAPGTNLLTTNYIGIADGAYASGTEATIQLSNPSIDDSQSGLTTASAYYVKTDGTLSTTPQTPSVYAGIALSATQLLIKG